MTSLLSCTVRVAMNLFGLLGDVGVLAEPRAFMSKLTKLEVKVILGCSDTAPAEQLVKFLVPPKEMFELLTVRWGIGRHLSLALLSHFGGHGRSPHVTGRRGKEGVSLTAIACLVASVGDLPGSSRTAGRRESGLPCGAGPAKELPRSEVPCLAIRGGRNGP
jgi:hypothetical protein